MFSRAGQKATNTLNAADFSHALKSGSAWKQADLSSFGILGEIACLAYDPVASLLCVGTAAGQLYLFGRPVCCSLSWLAVSVSIVYTRAYKSHGAHDLLTRSSCSVSGQTLPY